MGGKTRGVGVFGRISDFFGEGRGGGRHYFIPSPVKYRSTGREEKEKKITFGQNKSNIQALIICIILKYTSLFLLIFYEVVLKLNYLCMICMYMYI